MWTISFALFFGCKWLTWWQGRRPGAPVWRNFAYLFAWPGMDAREFLNADRRAPKPSIVSWLKAILRTLFGIWLLWGLTPVVPASLYLLRGWTGMAGVIFILHFGTFDLLALGWQTLGINAAPLMNSPVLSTSLAEFWGHRWNTAFNLLVFRPPWQRASAPPRASGDGRDSVGFPAIPVSCRPDCSRCPRVPVTDCPRPISPPRRWSALGNVRGQALGRSDALPALTAVPAFWLFHPAFIRNVILPMLQAIGAN